MSRNSNRSKSRTRSERRINSRRRIKYEYITESTPSVVQGPIPFSIGILYSRSTGSRT